jgi:carboxyl-terminal processing protease
LQLTSLFINDGKLVSIRERDAGSGHSLSTFSVNPKDLVISVKDETSGRVRDQHVKRLKAIAGNKQIVILVNGHSASASEMFTGALKDNGRATVVGERTFGKGIGQSVLRMPNGTSLHITSLRYFTPSGNWLGDGGNSSESYGIEPDHQVKLVETPKTRLGSPNDNQLSFALELIGK